MKADGGRRQASDMTRTLRALAAAPTSQSARRLRQDAADSVPAPSTLAQGQVPVERVEPEILRIGTGYVGTL